MKKKTSDKSPHSFNESFYSKQVEFIKAPATLSLKKRKRNQLCQWIKLDKPEFMNKYAFLGLTILVILKIMIFYLEINLLNFKIEETKNLFAKTCTSFSITFTKITRLSYHFEIK